MLLSILKDTLSDLLEMGKTADDHDLSEGNEVIRTESLSPRLKYSEQTEILVNHLGRIMVLFWTDDFVGQRGAVWIRIAKDRESWEDSRGGLLSAVERHSPG